MFLFSKAVCMMHMVKICQLTYLYIIFCIIDCWASDPEKKISAKFQLFSSLVGLYCRFILLKKATIMK